MPKPGGTIYAIGAQGTRWVKIGCTKLPVEERLQQLQTGQPFPLDILTTVPIQSNLRRIEQQVHAFLAEEHRRGEWFALSITLTELEGLIIRAVQYVQEEDARKARERAAKGGAASLPYAHPMMTTLAQRLQETRKRLGVSQSELAARAGVNRGNVNELEQLKKPSLRADTLVALADALGVSMDYLAGLTDDPRPRRPRRSKPADEEPESELAAAGGWEKVGAGGTR